MFISFDRHHLAMLIENSGLPIWWISKELGVSRITVGRWLKGTTRSMKKETAISLARVLNCSVVDLSCEKKIEGELTDSELLRLIEVCRANGVLEELKALLAQLPKSPKERSKTQDLELL